MRGKSGSEYVRLCRLAGIKKCEIWEGRRRDCELGLRWTREKKQEKIAEWGGKISIGAAVWGGEVALRRTSI